VPDGSIVSSDVIGNSHSSIFDALWAQVVGDNVLKTLTWYDNSPSRHGPETTLQPPPGLA
jgi:glyceraldehyde-3-phosphate dehydrogenase/erythrose-4-phosphate dehydrogenase